MWGCLWVVFLLGSLASLFGILASLFTFQILGAVGFFILTFICLGLLGVITSSWDASLEREKRREVLQQREILRKAYREERQRRESVMNPDPVDDQGVPEGEAVAEKPPLRLHKLRRITSEGWVILAIAGWAILGFISFVWEVFFF